MNECLSGNWTCHSCHGMTVSDLFLDISLFPFSLIGLIPFFSPFSLTWTQGKQYQGYGLRQEYYKGHVENAKSFTRITHLGQEICDIKTQNEVNSYLLSRRGWKTHHNSTNTTTGTCNLDIQKDPQTREPNSNNSAKGDTCDKDISKTFGCCGTVYEFLIADHVPETSVVLCFCGVCWSAGVLDGSHICSVVLWCLAVLN